MEDGTRNNRESKIIFNKVKSRGLTPIVKIIIYFTMMVLVGFGIVYSIAATTGGLLCYHAVELHRQGREAAAEGYLDLAAKANPLDFKPLFDLGALKHRQGTEKRDVRLLKEAKEYLKDSHQLNPNYLRTDLLLFDIDSQMGRPPTALFRDLKKLNDKYPNELLVQKLLAEHGIPLWDSLDQKDRRLITEIIYILLLERYWQNEDIIKLYCEHINDIELLKKIIPQETKILVYIKYVLSKYKIQFDYLWLAETIDEIDKKNIFYLKDREIFLDTFKKNWLNIHKVIKSRISDKEFMGWFTNGQPIANGKMWTNGTIYGVVLLTPESQNIVVTAKSSRANNIPAFMTVWLDNTIIDGFNIESEEYKEYFIPVTVKTQKNTVTVVSISFENDYFDRANNNDRNLYIDSLEVR